MPRLLEGDVIEVPRTDESDAKVRRLEADLRTARLDTEKALAELETARSAIQALRQALLPIHRALKAVFGEIDMAVGDDGVGPAASSASAPPQDARVSAVWSSWKQKLGGTVAKGIDALMLHGELDTAQLAIAAGLDRRTVSNTVIYKLNQAGLINKNNGRFSLKQL